MPAETEREGEQYVTCPAPACNREGRRSVISDHLADSDDQRHAMFDGSEV